jgi:hypothetical protein
MDDQRGDLFRLPTAQPSDQLLTVSGSLGLVVAHLRGAGTVPEVHHGQPAPIRRRLYGCGEGYAVLNVEIASVVGVRWSVN